MMDGSNVGIEQRGPLAPNHQLSYDVAEVPVGSTNKHKRQRSTSSHPTRRRISRACDQCNQLRTKCNGDHPCTHCVEYGLTCEYARQRKKRGKASQKDLAAAQSSNGDWEEQKSGETATPAISQTGGDHDARGMKRKRISNVSESPNGQQFVAGAGSVTSVPQSGATTMHAPEGVNMTEAAQSRALPMEQQVPAGNMPIAQVINGAAGDRVLPPVVSTYNSMDDYHRASLQHPTAMSGHSILHNGTPSMQHSMIPGGTITGYGENPYVMPAPASNTQQMSAGSPFQMGQSPSSGLASHPSMAGSPPWYSAPSPSATMYPGLQPTQSIQALRYPVLRPLIPYITSIMPIGLACDLLDLYFSSTSSIFMQPQSPYILGYVFRKRSMLRQDRPRPCSPALLASILWVAAQTSESAFLSSSPSARGRICQKLLELIVSLLKPLIHAEGAQGYGADTVVNGVALGGFGVLLGTSTGASGSVDDVATYIHLATVVSASEYKGASLRWWNSAWSLARELRLCKEMPAKEQHPDAAHFDGQHDPVRGSIDAGPDGSNDLSGALVEEDKEERRRIWWVLYAADRHLALCYNRPLYLLDFECGGLYQPENDLMWQEGEFYTQETRGGTNQHRRAGPSIECMSHSMFGYFLPLMTILGEIVDLYHARNHPRTALRFNSSNDWDAQAHEIVQQLEMYGQSLRDFEMRNTEALQETPEAHREVANTTKANGSPPRMSEATLQTKIVVAYGTYLMHTLHILVNGKWDPIALLDDSDLWISSQDFITATGHAVSAAEALDEVLNHDPDLSFMPFFFGVYILQGSFLLLLIADKLQSEASPNIVKACETIVRAHEACVVTLSTEYQRNFRKVMRSALAQVRGRMLDDFAEPQRRREVLALYRWTENGTGLAL